MAKERKPSPGRMGKAAVQVFIDPPEYARFQAACALRGLSMSEGAQQAFRAYADGMRIPDAIPAPKPDKRK